MEKKISYITLISDIYVLFTISLIIYGIFFSFERIGISCFTIKNINTLTAVNISILEMILLIITAYLLHKSNSKKVRIALMVLCLLNIIYRIANLIFLTNPFTLFMLIINIVLLIILLLYKKN